MEGLEVSDGWLAFQGEVDQHSYIAASSYSDQWTEIKDAQGNVIGSINSWYICQAKTAYTVTPGGEWVNGPCLRITTSKGFATKHADPLAPKQRWYCSCHCKYNANWGQIVEIARLNTATNLVEKVYLKSDIPPWDVEDIRAMDAEAKLKPVSAQELFLKVKALKPTLCEFIVKDSEGHHRLDGKEVFDNLPEFKWNEIYNMV